MPTAPGVPLGEVIPGDEIVPCAVCAAVPLAVPLVGFGSTTPLVPVDPVSGTQGIVAGGVVVGVAGAVTLAGDDGDCVPIEGVCASAGAETASAAAAAQAMSVEVLCMTPPYSHGGVCTGRTAYLDETV